MPSNDREADVVDVDGEERPREKRRSKSDKKSSDKDREHRSSHRSKSTRSKVGDSDTASLISSTKRHRKRKDGDKEKSRDKDRDRDQDGAKERSASASDLMGFDDSMSRLTVDTHRISMPYPNFSKAHSKEAVQSRDDLSTTKQSKRSNPLTPEPTDVGGGDDDRRSSKKSSRPPTPPETDVSADKRRTSEEAAMRSSMSSLSRSASRREDKKRADDPDRSTISGVSRSGSRHDDRSKISRKSTSSSQATYVKPQPTNKSHEKVRSSLSRESSRRSASSRHQKMESLETESSPSSAQDSSPKTPTQTPQFPPRVYDDIRRTSSPASGVDESGSQLHSKTATPASRVPSYPPPPPPPPPPLDIHDIPRVDYLLQNGGLPYPAPRHFLAVLPLQNGSRPSNPPLIGADTLFAPFFNLLEQYANVVSKQGSIAVATGHRSVARRLLDRLENVFSRDLPPHGCACIMCDKSHEIHRGLTWGDVLEWVSGRIDLPQWPPFDLAEIGTKAAEVSGDMPPRPASPVKMDPDIAEEFREHYLRQTKKVRSAVDKWLNNTGETPVPPPQDVDDETLTFAILTNLDAEDRPYFNALMSGSRELRPATRAPTPLHRPRNEFIIKTGLSLQRLYRLSQVPRDAESATYLIKNPHTHDLLVTISNINASEWEILTSGRFDGFLWSGADAEGLTPGFESRGATPASYFGGSTRNTTPFSPYSRGATPASFISVASSGMPGGKQPVSNDEEMEIAAIAEIEREIYTGMESLEDAFEKLHHRAEVVRTALRQRGAGLMQNLQNRRRIDVLPIPGSGNSQNSGYERPTWAIGSDEDAVSESEWGGMDEIDIFPDDSASNISSSRHRRPKRRVERRTPAPIEEGDEE